MTSLRRHADLRLVCFLEENSAALSSLRARHVEETLGVVKKLLCQAEKFKGKFERARQLHVKKKTQKRAPERRRPKAYLSGVVPSCRVSTDLKSVGEGVAT